MRFHGKRRLELLERNVMDKKRNIKQETDAKKKNKNKKWSEQIFKAEWVGEVR